MFVCRHCGTKFEDLSGPARAAHSKWCDKNPKRNEYGKDTKHLHSPEVIAKRAAKIKTAHASGKYAGSGAKMVETRKRIGTFNHSEKTKKILSEVASKLTHRRLLKSTREYIKKDGTRVLLDSSWEEILARRLDELGIEWIRPSTPVKWIDKSGKQRNYFPDFYLPQNDLYLDPKNPVALNAQSEKVDFLTTRMTNLVILKTVDECRNFMVES